MVNNHSNFWHGKQSLQHFVFISADAQDEDDAGEDYECGGDGGDNDYDRDDHDYDDDADDDDNDGDSAPAEGFAEPSDTMRREPAEGIRAPNSSAGQP